MTKAKDEEKKSPRELALDALNKKWGKGAATFLNDKGGTMGVQDVIPTDTNLDGAIGVGGIPKGRIVEIYGPESSGKSTLALYIIACAQQGGGHAALVDAEHAFEPSWGRKVGVNVDDLIVSQPMYGEQGLDIVEGLIPTNDIIVVDSVSALVPKAELDGEMGDATMGLHARLMSQALRKITGAASQHGTTIIFINQIRDKIGVMFGNPETTTGGRALKFWSAVRMDVRWKDRIKEKGEIVGNRVRVKVVKNKVAPPYKNCELIINFVTGKVSNYIDVDTLIADAVACGVITKEGRKYVMLDNVSGQFEWPNKSEMKTMLTDNEELYERAMSMVEDAKEML